MTSSSGTPSQELPQETPASAGAKRGSHAPSGAFQHYYVAVGSSQDKLATLVDLLDVVAVKAGLPLVIACRARDDLDKVLLETGGKSNLAVQSLHSDLSDSERLSRAADFHQTCASWTCASWTATAEDERAGEWGAGAGGAGAAAGGAGGGRRGGAHVLVATDVCLPQASLGEAPFTARVLINYDPPTRKEMSLRRISQCFGSGQTGTPSRGATSANARGIIIHLVTASQVQDLLKLEESSGVLVEEMPIHISELL